MSAMLHLRTLPDDCEVGDWVAAASVPEWPVDVPSRSHQPLVNSLTEAALDAPLQEVGDGVPLRQEPWHFELTEMKIGDEDDVAVWRRVS